MVKMTGSIIVSIPGAVHNLVSSQVGNKYIHYSAYLWIDDDRALYLHGSVMQGRSSGTFAGKYADQLGTQYFTDLEGILQGQSLQEALEQVKSCQIDSKLYSWSGDVEAFFKLIGVKID